MIAYMSVLVMAAAPHVHRQYGHVRPWQKCVVNGIIFHGLFYDHLSIVEFHAIWVLTLFINRFTYHAFKMDA
jgi:hypothetical protein